MTVRATVLKQIEIVAAQQHKTLQPLSDDMHLIDSGLDSLCLAILVANLDDELSLDPFGTGDDVPIPVTVGDLITLYENAAA
jgi:acyl carrier protein